MTITDEDGRPLTYKVVDVAPAGLRQKDRLAADIETDQGVNIVADAIVVVGLGQQRRHHQRAALRAAGLIASHPITVGVPACRRPG